MPRCKYQVPARTLTPGIRHGWVRSVVPSYPLACNSAATAVFLSPPSPPLHIFFLHPCNTSHTTSQHLLCPPFFVDEPSPRKSITMADEVRSLKPVSPSLSFVVVSALLFRCAAAALLVWPQKKHPASSLVPHDNCGPLGRVSSRVDSCRTGHKGYIATSPWVTLILRCGIEQQVAG